VSSEHSTVLPLARADATMLGKFTVSALPTLSPGTDPEFGNLALSWPADATGFELQRIERLGSDTNWVSCCGVETQPALGRNRALLPPLLQGGFFRLRRP
jgi:hypothetical protein